MLACVVRAPYLTGDEVSFVVDMGQGVSTSGAPSGVHDMAFAGEVTNTL